jgi:UDP-glucose 4-epimerase
VTGVSHFLGGELARRLEARADVSAIYGLDIDDPKVALDRTEFVHADTRHSLLTKLVRGLGVDTVVHCAVLTEGRTPARAVHETNVIGTMNLLAACSGPDSPVRRVVVKSSVAVYGCEPYAPSFLRESMSERAQVSEFLANDLREMEQLVQDFNVRNPAATVTMLRLGHRLGMREMTPLGEYFLLSRVPTFHGFDPRLQLLHDEDAVEALYRAAAADHGGVYNLAGDGILLLSQAIKLAGRAQLPVLFPFWRAIGRAELKVTGFDLPPAIADFLAYGCVVDIDAIEAEFGWRPPHTTRDTLHDFLARGDTGPPPSGPQEYELSQYLQRRRRLAAGARS